MPIQMRSEVACGNASSSSARAEVYKRAARVSCNTASPSKFLASSEHMPENSDSLDKVDKTTDASHFNPHSTSYQCSTPDMRFSSQAIKANAPRRSDG